MTRIVLAALAALSLLPSTAAAATLRVSNGTLTYAGGAGSQASDVDLGEPSAGTIRVAPQPDDHDAISPGAGCAANGDTTYTCTGVARVSTSRTSRSARSTSTRRRST